jgi:ferric-dicitrate binding protein FerR (iron transport regulator)
MSTVERSLHDLLEAWATGTLAGPERDDLRRRLIADPALLAEARTAMHQHLLLTAWFDRRPAQDLAQAVDGLLEAGGADHRRRLIANVAARLTPRSTPAVPRPAYRRRWLVSALAAGVAVVAGWWLLLPDGGIRGDDGRALASGAAIGGERPRAVHWRDGSVVRVAAGTDAQLAGDATHKAVRLHAGRLHAEVATQDGGSFAIRAPHGEITVVGTTFSVTSMASATVVQVDEGRVRVRAGTGGEQHLEPGEVARLDGAGIARLPRLGDDDRALLAAHPPSLAWSDRRPIGMFVFGLQNSFEPGNPNGWFEDATLDVRTPAGRDVLRRRFLERVEAAIVQLKRLDAQGVVWWNPEGNRWLGRMGYVGDAARLGGLAPEIDAIADEVMARFRAAGLRTGVVVRPWVLEGDAMTLAIREESTGVRERLSARIAYARRRWGCTLFPVMQAHQHWSGARVAHDDLAAVAAVHPQVLLIPDQERLPQRAVSAGWTSSRGLPSSSEIDRATLLYPGSPRLVHVQHDPGDQERNAALRAALRDGAIAVIPVSGTHALRWGEVLPDVFGESRIP